MTHSTKSPVADEATDVFMNHRELMFSLVHNKGDDEEDQ